MKKLMVTAVGFSVLVLLIGGCGTDVDVNWDEFFNEYYSECVQLYETCAEWAEMCNIEDTVKACTERQWYKGLRNFDCNGYIKEVTLSISQKGCDLTLNKCLLKDEN